MINPKALYDLFQEQGLDSYAGVPDSLLKDFCGYVTDNTPIERNVITANEGAAIALQAGYHLATGKVGVVYMQNSGLGNCVNPLTSLVDKAVYSIPMLLVVGWRGEPGKKDEPQHLKMGQITPAQLTTLGIEYAILPDSIEEAQKVVSKAKQYMAEKSVPFALLVRKGTFESYKLQTVKQTNFELSREQAVQTVASSLGEKDIIVSTTGKTSRELFEYRANNNLGHEKDFLCVGNMGHTAAIALGVAMQKTQRNVYCFDGDGSVIMHMGTFSTIAQLKPKNLCHIVFNNFAHDSVGGQPTASDVIDISAAAKANGYTRVFKASTTQEIQNSLEEIKSVEGPCLLEILVNKGARKDLGRPTRTPQQNKLAFMEFVKND